MRPPMDTVFPRQLIRLKLKDGRLPYDHIARVSGGPDAMEMCDACETPIQKDEILMEGTTLEGGRKPLQLHVKCFGIWDSADVRRVRRQYREGAVGY
jgi:hypothetical protein